MPLLRRARLARLRRRVALARPALSVESGPVVAALLHDGAKRRVSVVAVPGITEQDAIAAALTGVGAAMPGTSTEARAEVIASLWPRPFDYAFPDAQRAGHLSAVAETKSAGGKRVPS